MTEARTVLKEKAAIALFDAEHDMKTKKGIIDLLAATGMALLHDVPGLSIQKANTLTYQGSVILRALQE